MRTFYHKNPSRTRESQEKVWKLTSKSHFFEIFATDAAKNPQNLGFFLPETVIFEDGAPKLWLFHSKRLKTRELLHKSAKTLSFPMVCRRFLGVADEEALKLAETARIPGVSEEIAGKSKENAAFVRFFGKSQGFAVSERELARIFLEKRAHLAILQEFVAPKSRNSKENATFLCEMQRKSTNPCTFRVWKEFQVKSQGEHPEIAKISMKSLDSRTNERISEALARISEVFASFGVKTARITGKFLFDRDENLVFLGFRSVFCDEVELWRDLVEADGVSFEEIRAKGWKKQGVSQVFP